MANDDQRFRKIAETAFENALNAELPKDENIESLIEAFENKVRSDEMGNEYWTARDLASLLEYSDYRNFANLIEKAKLACVSSGQTHEDHFVNVTEMVALGSGAERAIEDVQLSRYACYLTAQNGDPRKKSVAFAQTYFAIQARRQELQDIDPAFGPMSEDQKRCLLRDEMKEHNKHLASAAKSVGVTKPLDYAIFQTYGYKGLYGGLDRIGIQRKKKLKASQNILDHMGSTELAANLFRATQTEEKLQRDDIKNKEAANEVHREVGAKVRQTIRDIGGTMPEDLEPAEDIKKVARRLKKVGITKG